MYFDNCWCRWIFGLFLASCPFGYLVYRMVGWLFKGDDGINIYKLQLIKWLTKYWFNLVWFII